MNDSVLFEVSDGVAKITLNRPERLNAFGEETAEAWAATTKKAVSRDDVKVVLLTGNGRAFCAGGDVHEMAMGGYDKTKVATLARLINEGQQALLGSAVPVIAAAHGTTAGGGLGILLNSDYAVIGESSKVGSIYAKVGLTPDLTVTALLARAVGERRALELVLFDRMLSSSEALEWGVVAEVVSDDDVLRRGEELARFIVSIAPNARGQAKRLVRSVYGRTLAESLSDEATTIGSALAGDEARALIGAFLGARRS